MREWWQNLGSRDRQAIAGGIIVLLLFGFYAFVWEPLLRSHNRAQAVVTEQRALAAWMHAASAEALQLRAQQSTTHSPSPRGSLLATIDRTVRAAGLERTVKRIQPDGTTRVRVWIEEAAFDQMIRWLEELERKQGLAIEDLRVDRQKPIGRVDARIVLTQGAS